MLLKLPTYLHAIRMFDRQVEQANARVWRG